MTSVPQQWIVSLIHLGCCKNLIDSEKILGELGNVGYAIAQEPTDSDIVLVNTCGFIESARTEARETLSKVLKLKKQGKVQAVVAIGCMVQLYGEQLQQEFPTLDGVIGFSDYNEIHHHLESILAKQQKQFISPTNTFIPHDELRLRVTFPNYAYLRITEGCSNCCNYCTIPKIRGSMRSKPLEDIIKEAKIMIQDGAKELIVIGQDTAGYGRDLPNHPNLYDLTKQLSQLEGLQWLRIMYVHPKHFQESFLSLFELPHVVPYLEMPIQHIHPRILQAMGRGHDDTLVKNLISKLRNKIPQLILRSTVMVGYPGETEEEFSTLLNFIRSVKFDRLGAFMYSKEPGTKSAELPDDIPAKVKQSRYDQIMQAQQEIAYAWAKSMVGRELTVVVEEEVERKTWRTRSYGEAPEIDPAIYVCGNKAKIGTFRQVKIVQSQGYDLIGKFL